jgi:hypothetical protein
MDYRDVLCQECGAVLRLESDLEPGKRIRCPRCKQVFAVPEEEARVTSASRPFRAEERDQSPPPSRRPRRDEDDYDDRPRRPRRKKKSGSGALIIGLCLGGVMLAAVVTLVIVGIKQDWFSSKSKSDSVASEEKTKPSDKDKPDRPDKSNKPDTPVTPATGQVRVIPPNILDQVHPRGAEEILKEAEYLKKVEQRLGAPGKKLTPAELNEACNSNPSVATIRNISPNAYCYRWTSPRAALYIFFERGEWRGETAKSQ